MRRSTGPTHLWSSVKGGPMLQLEKTKLPLHPNLIYSDGLTGQFWHETDRARLAFEELATREDLLDWRVPTDESFNLVLTHGPALTKKGWLWFAQQRGREPSRCYGKMIAFVRQLTRPTGMTWQDWAWMYQGTEARENIAMTGAGTGAVGIDIDIHPSDAPGMDPIAVAAMARRVEEIVVETLGPTPFRRTGNAPKILLVYRCLEAFDTTAIGFATAEKHAVEFLAGNRPFTAYGIHHKTGLPYAWDGLHPAIAGPEHAPLVTAAQIAELRERIAREFKVVRGTGSRGVEIVDFIPEGELRIPEGREEDFPRNADGLVEHNRHAFVRDHVWAAIIANVQHLGTDEGVRGLIEALYQHLLARMVTGDRDYSQRGLHAKISSDVWSNAHKARRGELQYADGSQVQPYRMVRSADGQRYLRPHKAAIPYPKRGRDLSWLPEPKAQVFDKDAKTGLTSVLAVHDVDRERKRQERAIPDSPAVASTELGWDMLFGWHAIEQRLDELDGKPLPERIPLWLQTYGVGSGKTTDTLRGITAWLSGRRRRLFDVDPGPVVFASPAWTNLGEAAQILERLGFREVLRGGEARILEDADGVRVAAYGGKERSGCEFPQKIRALRACGLSSAAVCKADVEVTERHEQPDGTVVEETRREPAYCEAYARCPYQKIRQELATVDMVLVPHALVAMTIPKEIAQARVLIVDESITKTLVHQARLGLDVLLKERAKPLVTKKDKEEGTTAEDLLDERRDVNRVYRIALLHGADLADAMVRVEARKLVRKARAEGRVETLESVREAATQAALELVKSAARVCGGMGSRVRDITPDTEMWRLEELADAPKGDRLHEERRLHLIVQERLEALVEDAKPGAILEGKVTATPERRIQLLRRRIGETKKGKPIWDRTIRIAWMSKPNWSASPTILLDASARQEILGLLYPQHEIIVQGREMPSRIRRVAVMDHSFAASRFIPRPEDPPEMRAGAAHLVAQVRNAIIGICGQHGYGRVLVVATRAVRRLLTHRWPAPENASFAHYGALRGLDFAKNYVACIAIGRSEMPIDVVDATVAALQHQLPADRREPIFDIDGTGEIEVERPDGKKVIKPLLRPRRGRIVELRTGHDLEIEVGTMPGSLAEAIDLSWREEELVQTEGRLRAVHRHGPPPVLYLFTNVIPSNFIIDEVHTLDGILSVCDPWIMAHGAYGVVCDRIWQKVYGVEAGEMGNKAGWNRALKGRGNWGMTLVRADAGPGTKSWHAMVQSSCEDPVERYRGAAEAHGIQVENVELVQRGAALVPAPARTPDELDTLRTPFLECLYEWSKRNAETKREGAYDREVAVARQDVRLAMCDWRGEADLAAAHDDADVEADGAGELQGAQQADAVEVAAPQTAEHLPAEAGQVASDLGSADVAPDDLVADGGEDGVAVSDGLGLALVCIGADDLGQPVMIDLLDDVLEDLVPQAPRVVDRKELVGHPAPP
ncbi:hypothetical protein [Salinarimonas rosea]|uniref:hypothetical protein n=1 Tax=Salinarimonas rosea TaxID=552063 RepID=UPI00048F9D65|nr:hypothetical protein [Salinarimonas rosea]